MDTTAEEIQQLKKNSQLMISQISHEIRNPVTLISSSLQLIEKEHPEVHSFAFWDETMKDLMFLKELLNQLSDYNNGESLHLEVINTGEWLQELCLSIEPICAQRTLGLKKEISPDLPAITGDKVKLRQALYNLLRNACESMDQGEVSLSARESHGCLLIDIQDMGCGIPEEYRETLFEPFVTHKKGGTGLGLSIARKVVEAHGGTMAFTSILDSGTCFHISLPIQEDA